VNAVRSAVPATGAAHKLRVLTVKLAEIGPPAVRSGDPKMHANQVMFIIWGLILHFGKILHNIDRPQARRLE